MVNVLWSLSPLTATQVEQTRCWTKGLCPYSSETKVVLSKNIFSIKKQRGFFLRSLLSCLSKNSKVTPMFFDTKDIFWPCHLCFLTVRTKNFCLMPCLFYLGGCKDLQENQSRPVQTYLDQSRLVLSLIEVRGTHGATARWLNCVLCTAWQNKSMYVLCTILQVWDWNSMLKHLERLQPQFECQSTKL